MKNVFIGFLSLILWCGSSTLFAQGPPITADKPILLGSKAVVLKTLSEIRNREDGTFTRIPFMAHYLPTSNSLVAIHTPLVIYDDKNLETFGSGVALADISILSKYQFYRKDKTGKTLRMVAKTLQTLPTGKNLGINDISLGEYQSYFAGVIGYETIKYGISGEIGYNLVPNTQTDEFRVKTGFGLPLLKPSYPVKQVNLYFEYTSNWFTQLQIYELLYAQGVQYAIKRLTLEMAVQVPLTQTRPENQQLNYSLFFGTRYVF
ncbi:MAG: hypothetical protein AAF598_11330 [Bacteroidota bacterium]